MYSGDRSLISLIDSLFRASDNNDFIDCAVGIRMLWVLGIFIIALIGGLLPLCITRNVAVRADRAIAICSALAGEFFAVMKYGCKISHKGSVIRFCMSCCWSFFVTRRKCTTGALLGTVRPEIGAKCHDYCFFAYVL